MSYARGLRICAIALTLVATWHAKAQQPATAAPPPVSVEAAYKKEYAFLQAQKRELGARIASSKADLARERSALEAEIKRLEARLLAVKSEAEALSDALTRADEAAQASADNRDLVEATREQARTTLSAYGLPDASASENQAASEQLRDLFAFAQRTLDELGRVRQAPGTFYLADGSQVQGTIVRLGNVAAWGVSGKGSGALVPAGGGALRLWQAPGQDGSASAAALAAGKPLSPLGVYLFENANSAVSEPEAKTLGGEVRKGGFIGYVILGLGLLGLLLIGLRALFLKNAGAAIAPTIEAVLRPLGEQRIEDAIAAAKRYKGSAARVVTAALRNLDRDREHLEDIIGESILHESGHLNRFAGFIGVIAAVAPLLGLLGTVTGMIQTFDIITEFGTSDPKLLSGGIATALVTTELGLIVAIPMLLLGNLLGGWAERIKDDMERAALRVVNAHMEVQFSLARRKAA